MASSTSGMPSRKECIPYRSIVALRHSGSISITMMPTIFSLYTFSLYGNIACVYLVKPSRPHRLLKIF